jgi:hypothetical protein
MNSATIQARVFKGYGKAAVILGECYAFYHSVSVDRLLGEDGTPILTELGAEIHLPTSRYVLDENGNKVFGEDGRPLLTELPPSYILDEDGQKVLAEDGSGIEAEQGNPPGQSPLANAPYAKLFVSLNAEDMGYRRPNKYGKATWFALFDARNAVVGDYLVGDRGTFFIAAMQLLLPILVVECNRVVTVFRPQVQGGVGAVEYSGTTTANQTAIMTGWPCSILQGTKGEKNETALPGDTRSPWWTILLPKADTIQILPNDIITDDLGLRYVISSTELSDLGWRLTAMTAVA